MDIEAKIQKDFDLKPLTTFKIGGKAKYFLEVGQKEELAAALDWAKDKHTSIFILAGGSNVLVSDVGIDGLVVKMSNRKVAVKGERIEAGAGAMLPAVVSAATAHNLSGMEWAAGIPGSLGGAIRGNAGAYGGNMAESVETVEVFDMKKGQFDILSRKFCKFDYRHSLFKDDKSLVIWSAILKMHVGNKDEILGKINDILEKRKKANPKLPSAGCVFKNFTIEDIEKANPRLAQDARDAGVVKGSKVGAGWIIEQLDLKGKKMGEVKVSLEHANFIVNTGQARADEVIMMTSYIKQQVRDELGIQLQEEIEYFGI